MLGSKSRVELGGVGTVSRLPVSLYSFLSNEHADVLVEGIKNRQGVIELRAKRADGVVAELTRRLGSRGCSEIVLGQGVVIHAIQPSCSEGGRERFSRYLAVVSTQEQGPDGAVATQMFQVPLTEIPESSFLDACPNNWEHAAFFSHLGWLGEQYGDVSAIRHRPTFLLPCKSVRGQTTLEMPDARAAGRSSSWLGKLRGVMKHRFSGRPFN